MNPRGGRFSDLEGVGQGVPQHDEIPKARGENPDEIVESGVEVPCRQEVSEAGIDQNRPGSPEQVTDKWYRTSGM